MKINFGQYRKIIILSTAGIAILIVVFALIIHYAGTDKRTEQLPPITDTVIEYLFPDTHKQIYSGEWLSLLKQDNEWDWDRILKFWVDTEQIGVKMLEETNDDLIFNTFQKFE